MGVPMWCRDATFAALVLWLQSALHTYELVDPLKTYYSWVEAEQIGLETQEREVQRIEIQERGEVTDRERKRVGKGFSPIHLELVYEIRRTVDEQHANHTITQVKHQSWGRQQERGRRRTNQGGGRRRRRRGGEGARPCLNGEEGPATRAEASTDQVHGQASPRTQAFRPQQTPKVEVGHHKRQREDRTVGFDLDELCPDVPKELDRAEEDVSGQASRRIAAYEAEPRTSDSLATRVSLQGKCRRTHGRRGGDGDRRAPRASTSGAMGNRYTRRRRGGRRWAQQRLQRTPALWAAKQGCQDRQGKETCGLNVRLSALGWSRIQAWLLLPLGLGRGFYYHEGNAANCDFYHENHTGNTAKQHCLFENGAMWNNQPTDGDLWNQINKECDYMTAEGAMKSYYCDGNVMKQNAYKQEYGMKKCDYLNVKGDVKSYYCHGNDMKHVTYNVEYNMTNFNYEIVEDEMKSYYPDGNAKKLFVLKDGRTNMEMHEVCTVDSQSPTTLAKKMGKTNTEGRQDFDAAPTILRQQLYHYYTGKCHESTWEDFNSTKSGTETHDYGKGSLMDFWSTSWNSDKVAPSIALTGIFLFCTPLFVAWVHALFRFCLKCLHGAANYEHLGGEIYCVSFGIGLTLLPILGNKGVSDIQSEWEAYDMSLRIMGSLCIRIVDWCWSNKCGTLVIAIVGATMALIGYEAKRLLCRQAKIERGCVRICRQRRTTRRRIPSLGVGITRPMLCYLLAWSNFGAMAEKIMLGNTMDDLELWTQTESDVIERQLKYPFWESFSAGSKPERVREQSHELYQRMQRTHEEERRQWDIERETVNRDAQVTGQLEIQDEFDALERHRQGAVQLFLYGIQQHQIGLEVVQVQRDELEDFLDILVIVRRAWSQRIPIFLFHIAYINPQAPPVVMNGIDALSLICDFAPTLQGTPIAILSSTTFPGDETTYDLSVHRASHMIGCDDILRLTGFLILCASTARCTCSYGGRSIDVIPTRTFPGMRIDVVINFQSSWCHDNTTTGQHETHSMHVRNDSEGDEQPLMQTTVRARATVNWLYAYPLYGRDAIKAWEGGRGEREHARYLAELYRLQRPQYYAREMRCLDIRPQPEDLTDHQIKGHVIAIEEEIKPWQVLILLDIVWLSESGESTGAMPPREDIWRAAKLVDFQIDLKTLFEQIGISVFCEDRTACTTWIRGFEWRDENRLVRINDGDYIKIRVSSARTDTPLGTQWDLAQQGCRLEEMPHRLAPRSSTDPTDTTTTRAPTTNASSINHENEDQTSGDPNSLMQQPIPDLRTFVYLEGENEPLAEHLTGHEVRDPIPSLRHRMMRRVPEMRGEQLLFFWVNPQPQDLLSMTTTGYLHTIVEQLKPGKSIIMLDVEFYGNKRPQWRAKPTPSNEWREIRFVMARTTRFTLLEEVGLKTFCYGTDTVCFVHVKGLLWPTQDKTPREIAPGDYIQVKIKANEDKPVSEQWREANGVCDEPPRHEYQQALLDHDEHRHGGDSDDVQSSATNMSLLQVALHVEWRATPAAHARDRLPPPGNGPKKRVAFSDLIVKITPEGRLEPWKDHLISNDFVLGSVQRNENKGCNEIFEEYLHNIRFEDMRNWQKEGCTGTQEHQVGRTLPLSRLPLEDEAIDESPHERDHDECNHHLPILEEENGYAPCSGHTAQLDEQDTHGVYELHRWLERVKVMPHYDTCQVQWKEASKPWANIETWALQEAEEMWFYVDGTKKEKEAAAGVVMYVKAMDRWFHGGYLGEYIDNHDGKKGIYEAELLAQIIAYKWIYDEIQLQVFNFGKVPKIKIIYDSQSAGQAALGGIGGNINNIYFVAARSIAHFVTHGCGWEVIEEHQRSHEGNPGNESADDVARWGLTRKGKVNIWTTLLEPKQHRNLQWLWWIEKIRRKGECSKEEIDAFAWKKPTATVDQRIVAEMKEMTVPEVKIKRVGITMNVVSYNINTFNDQQKSDRHGKKFSPSKFEAFTRLCDEKKTHIFMLQETRLKRRIPAARDYHIFQGLAGRTGKGGVMIGISKTRGICTKTPVKEENVKVIMANEETLVLRVSDPSLRAIVISGHAPHSGLPESTIKKWWHELTLLMREKAHGWPLIFGIDSNGRVGSMISKHVGDHQQTTENYCGSQLHAFCIATDTILPSTFASHQWGDGATWQHPRGQLARIDYVGIPRRWKACNLTTYVDQELAINQTLYDHRPCRLMLKGNVETKLVEKTEGKMINKKPARVDYRNEGIKEQIATYLRDMEEPAWTTDVHRHLQSFYENLKKGLEDIAEGQTEAKRRKSYLSEETWQLVKAKRRHRQQLFEHRDVRKRAFLGIYFAIWKGEVNESDWYEQELAEAQTNEVYHYHMFQTIGSQVTKALRKEDDDFFGEFAKNLAHFDQPQCQRQLWKEIRRYLPRSRERKQTTPVEQIDGIDTKWVNYLCDLEAAKKRHINRSTCSASRTKTRANFRELLSEIFQRYLKRRLFSEPQKWKKRWGWTS